MYFPSGEITTKNNCIFFWSETSLNCNYLKSDVPVVSESRNTTMAMTIGVYGGPILRRNMGTVEIIGYDII